MSANRIVKRREFATSNAKASGQTWHDYAVVAGYRTPNFQKNLRAARQELGLKPTSSDMHNLHGKRV